MNIQNIIDDICNGNCIHCEMNLHFGCMCGSSNRIEYHDKIVDYFIRLFPDKAHLIDESLLPSCMTVTEEELMEMLE